MQISLVVEIFITRQQKIFQCKKMILGVMEWFEPPEAVLMLGQI